MKVTFDTENFSNADIKALAQTLKEITDWDDKETLVNALTNDLTTNDRGAMLTTKDYYIDSDEVAGMIEQYYNQQDMYNLFEQLIDYVIEDECLFDIFKYILKRFKYTDIKASKINTAFQNFIDTYNTED